VRAKKEKGLPKPWTKDEILQTYRFCNVFREDDKVTRWLFENYYPKVVEGGYPVWFAAAVARNINLPGTLEKLPFPFPWDKKRTAFEKEMRRLGKEGKIFNSAYMISTHGSSEDKPAYYCALFSVLWKDVLKITIEQTLAELHENLCTYKGVGSFMAAQVVADAKHFPYFKHAPDHTTFAASGPGSRRGLNRLLGRSLNESWKEKEWYEDLCELRFHVLRDVGLPRLKQLDAQNIQNCLCEFDKYERARLGQGRPKSLYPGKGDS
jgi:hypothetical protein